MNSIGRKIDPRVKALFSTNQKEVVRAVNALIQEPRPGKTEEQLIKIVSEWQNDDGYASLWSMVILGQRGSRDAIPCLLNMLDSEADYWKEAATDALTQIVREHGEAVLPPIEDFIEQRMQHDPFDAGLYAYSPLAVLKNSEHAKRFLIQAFELDDTWQAPIAHDLIKFEDKRVLYLLRRALEYALRGGDKIEFNELKDAYCILDGVLFASTAQKELWEEDWADRWSIKLSELGKSEEEIEAAVNARFKKLPELRGNSKYAEDLKKEIMIRDSHPLIEFAIEPYLEIRV